MTEFSLWLAQELERRGWSRSEAARRGEISASAMDKVIGGFAKPGLVFCQGIARAFHIPLDEVLRLAGILPENRPLAGADGLIRRLGALPRREQDVILVQMDALLRLAESGPVYDVRPNRSANPES